MTPLTEDKDQENSMRRVGLNRYGWVTLTGEREGMGGTRPHIAPTPQGSKERRTRRK